MKRISKLFVLGGLILLWSCGSDDPVEDYEPVFSVPADVSKTNAAGDNYTIAVTASDDVTWSATVPSGNGWITIATASGKGNGNAVFSLQANENPGEREVNVTFAASSDRSSKAIPSQVCVVKQLGATPAIEIDPAGEKTVPATADAGYIIDVTANVAWSASVAITSGPESWISVTAPVSPVTGIGEVKLNILENTAVGETRVATVTVASTADPSLKKTLTITQSGAAPSFAIFLPDYTALTTGTATMNISPYPAGTAKNLTVQVTSDESGATVEYTEALTAGDYLVNSFTYGANPAINVDAVITIDADGEVTFVEHWDAYLNLFGGVFEARPLTIASPAGLAALRDAVNNGKDYAGLYIKQTANIALSGEWEPIGNAAANPFKGMYNGDNRTVSNLNIASGTFIALFGYAGGVDADNAAVIKNLTVEGAGTDGNDVTGDAGATVAGIVAAVTANTLIENCTNRANIAVTGDSHHVAGIAANCTGDNITVKGCKNYGKIFGANGNCGGIVAIVTSTADENIFITGCHNYGNMETVSAATSVTGGILGRSTANAKAEIKWCSNRANITLTGGANSNNGTGGIVGNLMGNSVVRECFNLGKIDTRNNSGGIAGSVNGGPNTSIYNCYNRGEILFAVRTAVNDGGISGNATNYWTIPVEYCYNAGTTHPTPNEDDRYGAIIGANNIPGGVLTAFTGVKECFYETGLGYVGGLSGNVAPGDVIGSAEGKDAAGMKTATPYTANWDTNIWQFTAGQYPTLKNNPE